MQESTEENDEFSPLIDYNEINPSSPGAVPDNASPGGSITTDSVDHSDLDMEEVATTAPAAADVDMSQVGTDSSEANDGTNLPAAENFIAASVANEVNLSLETPTVVAEPVEAASDALVITDLS